MIASVRKASSSKMLAAGGSWGMGGSLYLSSRRRGNKKQQVQEYMTTYAFNIIKSELTTTTNTSGRTNIVLRMSSGSPPGQPPDQLARP